MRKVVTSQTVSTGLAIFSMFFGAGNLMFPIKVGLLAGQHTMIAMAGFLLTAVCLPLLGLVAIALFDGDYKAFFNRLGAPANFILTLFCMLIIGPLIAMPRIVTLSHIMISPFIGNISLLLFSLGFLFLTFLGTYRENKIIDLLGLIISPALLVSLGIIIGKGLFFAHDRTVTDIPPLTIFWESLITGYSTLDVLGAIFFSSIIITILKKNSKDLSTHNLALNSLKAGCLGISLLAIIYIGMSYLGTFYGMNLEQANEGELFSLISFRILGDHAALIIAIAVLMACYSTIIALAAVVAEYLKNQVFQYKISYLHALLLSLIATLIISNFGLDSILQFSAPIIEIGYPVLVTLTLCNVAYKLWGFKPVKVPVLITLLASIISYLLI